ncbi:hypothetical protein HDG34_005715 [Paraburkholderia sp. HC6.4b]|uniref:DUF2894 domain-containing protein n=1 Tax=unclassified Paraburkholderia TaxID=2615204 RepID=UPI0016137303|nr:MULTISPECIES: DUF2894 domain-containing protein [unclassified Paraburkholderia]MBB5411749.1 hypothetical protein [Paraburkholderia sp. HC6.4b]MBB5450061.1 hypothetical protein [Paraburkholderia sp. Kb1A]
MLDDAIHAARARLDAWRASGAARLDPVRFHLLDALTRRAAQHSGEPRRVLEQRLAGLLADYTAEVERAAADESASQATSGEANAANDATLAALIERLARHHARADAPRAAAYPDLPAVDYFREVWSKLRTEKQLRQSLAQVPGNAGPLNSSSLVHRALSLMRELSPEYLKQFLSYVDTLSWLEQMNGGAPLEKEAPRAATTGKGVRKKVR